MSESGLIIWDQAESVENIILKYLVNRFGAYESRMKFTTAMDREYKQVVIYLLLSKYSFNAQLWKNYKCTLFGELSKLLKKYGIKQKFKNSHKPSMYKFTEEYYITLSFDQLNELYYCLKTFEPTE
jgi:hypothetical protein